MILLLFFNVFLILLSFHLNFYAPILICTHAKLLQSCPTLCDPTDCSLTGSSVHGILHAGVGCHFLLQGIFITQGYNLCKSPELAGTFFTTSTTWKALFLWIAWNYIVISFPLCSCSCCVLVSRFMLAAENEPQDISCLSFLICIRVDSFMLSLFVKTLRWSYLSLEFCLREGF